MKEEEKQEEVVSEESCEETDQQEESQEEGASDETSEEDAEELGEEALEELEELDDAEKTALVEAVILAHGEPIGLARLKQVTGIQEKELRDLLETIRMKFELEDSGIELKSFSGKFQFRTKGRFTSYIQKLKAGRPRRLSPPALETLAIVAYRQPIVKSDIEKIRGVDATPTIKTLLERGLVRIVGHQATVGQPALYGTTDQFLSIFGLSSLAELPTLRDLKELEADPGEIEDLENEDQELEDQDLSQVNDESAEDETAIEVSSDVDENSEDPAEDPSVEEDVPLAGNA